MSRKSKKTSNNSKNKTRRANKKVQEVQNKFEHHQLKITKRDGSWEFFDREKILQYIDVEIGHKGCEDTLEADLKATESGRELLDNYNRYIEFKRDHLFPLEEEIAKLERKNAA